MNRIRSNQELDRQLRWLMTLRGVTVTTLLVCAFAGVERMRAAYEHAKAEGYRFYSYGDACLLERAA